VVDNGSTDGTGTYLAGVRDMSTVPVTVVSNATNVGFPAAINQGLRLARGEYLVMLNCLPCTRAFARHNSIAFSASHYPLFGGPTSGRAKSGL
jgi:hypothetical protein